MVPTDWGREDERGAPVLPGRVDTSPRRRPATPADSHHSRLVAVLEDQSVRFALSKAALATLTTSSPSGATALDRAFAALDLYIAREAIEEVEAALVRIASGRPSAASHATGRRLGRAQRDGAVRYGVSRRPDIPDRKAP